MEVRSARLQLVHLVPAGLMFDLPQGELEHATYIERTIRSLPDLVQGIQDSLALIAECEAQFAAIARMEEAFRERRDRLVQQTPFPGEEFGALQREQAKTVGDHRFRLMHWKSAARDDIEQTIFDFRVAMDEVKSGLGALGTMRSRAKMDVIDAAIVEFDTVYLHAKDRRDNARHPIDYANTPVKAKHKSTSGPFAAHGVNVESPGVQFSIGGTFGNQAVSTGKRGVVSSINLDEVVPNLVRIMTRFYTAWPIRYQRP